MRSVTASVVVSFKEFRVHVYTHYLATIIIFVFESNLKAFKFNDFSVLVPISSQLLVSDRMDQIQV